MELVRRIFLDKREIVLVGTSHISKESAELVKEVIEKENPDVVCLEWDKTRYNKYMNPDEWSDTDIVQVIKQKKLIVLISSVIYSLIQKHLAKINDSVPGAEFFQAVNSAEKSGAKLALVDRDSQITFKRFWRLIPLRKKALFPHAFGKVLEGAEDSKEEMKKLLNSENFEPIFEQLQQTYPELWESFLIERDLYMSTKILNEEGKKIVVIIGQAHLNGVEKNIKENRKANIEELDGLPPKLWSTRVLESIIPLIIIGLLIYSFVLGMDIGINQIIRWGIWNGGVAALFTVLALANPLTVITSLVLAPLATLLPMVSIGVFSAIVEATIRKPKVHDFQTMDEDLLSIKKIYKNRVLRIFLVFILASIGGTVGNIIGGLDIIKNLF
ncbi:MAG: TraB/GumN family protein [Enterococcus faecalis]|uniref:TraB/GumN family protein n=2 Tax=Enterococcus faecalis TaxID=1351 RepID=UPI000330EC79|nr:TraB/GumN family protein [Enterococcus faecalis]EOJ52740.1 TraB family protein [Enterococcus faecalis EnGen0363]MBW7655397.1 TraB/GumN family protein [Enterococcus faecalis]MDU3404946.1 TraB/GumN family protein [Enterococcus faecalis]MDU3436386.1 TraB/GumN family protein [Enterococcus faecalis]MDU3484584.1 TraB/GumN family protein [Enterococcus faecalis]